MKVTAKNLARVYRCEPVPQWRLNSRVSRVTCRPAASKQSSGLHQQTQNVCEQQHSGGFASGVPLSYLLPRQAVAMFAAGAALGPWCDGLHSQHNVLHYTQPSVQLQISSLHWSFETCWWVPLLFGAAGLILGVSVPVLDELTAAARSSSDAPASHTLQCQAACQQEHAMQATDKALLPTAPGTSKDLPVQMGLQQGTWVWVLLCISLFVTQYWLSGVLEQPMLGKTLLSSPIPTLDAVLFVYALLHWTIFDCTVQGFSMSVLTAVCGPALEIGLINLGGLYHYTHPVAFAAVPTWIVWVYFCGGPAVGNLGRVVWRELKHQHAQCCRHAQ